jgi:hypothetical protein
MTKDEETRVNASIGELMLVIQTMSMRSAEHAADKAQAAAIIKNLEDRIKQLENPAPDNVSALPTGGIPGLKSVE